MHDFLQSLAFSFSITGPIFVVLALGVYLRRIGLINDNFIDVGSKPDSYCRFRKYFSGRIGLGRHTDRLFIVGIIIGSIGAKA